MRQATLVFPVQGYPCDRVLLGLKKRGFGAFKWNGFGGKKEADEDPEESASRELREECCLDVTPRDLEKVAEMSFYFPSFPEWNMFVHTFIARTYRGKPLETEEMRPAWFSMDMIPFDEMWADDRYWLPLVLRGEKVKGIFTFNNDRATLAEHTLEKAKF